MAKSGNANLCWKHRITSIREEPEEQANIKVHVAIDRAKVERITEYEVRYFYTNDRKH